MFQTVGHHLVIFYPIVIVFGRVHIFKCSSVQKIQIEDSGDLETSSIEIFIKEKVRKLISLGQIRALSSMAVISLIICSGL